MREAGGIASAFDLGNVGRLDLFVKQLGPVEAVEEAMAFDVVYAIFKVAVAFGEVSL